MGNSGSPGNDSNPAEGLVLRELNLSNVPKTGHCTACFVALPSGGKVEAVTQAGLGTWPHDVSIAYDPAGRRVVLSLDNGPYDTPLRGTGSWQLQGSSGECLSGYTYNHNSGIVRTSNGDLPSSRQLEVIYAVANNNLGGTWGVWDYRLWDVSAPLTNAPAAPTLPAASASCPGLDLVDTAGRVTTGGSALNFGSVPSPAPTAPTAGLALTPDRHGYYLVATNGQVTTFGDAVGRGSLPTASPK